MKKVLFSLCLFFAAFSGAFAQQFTIDVSGGYCAPLASTSMTQYSTQNEIPNYPNYYTANAKVTNVSYGQGGNVALNVNWFSKKDIGCGIKLNAHISSPFHHSTSVNYLDGTSADFEYTEKGFAFEFIPHICFKHDFKIVTPVLEIGMIIGAASLTEDYAGTRSIGDVFSSSVNYSGNVMLGFYSHLGLRFKVSKAVDLMLSMTCTAASYSPSSWERTSYIYNGQDQTAYLPVNFKYGTFVNQLSIVTANQSSNMVHQDLKFSIPFSSVGFSAGIAFKIAQKARTKSKEKYPNPLDKNDY